MWFYLNVPAQEGSDDEGQPTWRVSRAPRHNKSSRLHDYDRSGNLSGCVTPGNDGGSDAECAVDMNHEPESNQMTCIEDPRGEDETNPLVTNLSSGNGHCTDGDKGSAHSQDDSCDQDLCAIDYEEIAAGRAAQMPGQWVSVPMKEDPTSASEELMSALQTKAEAFANGEWQSYWSLHGPSVLATCWTNHYPQIPLERIEALTGIGFLCRPSGEKMDSSLDRCTSSGEQDEEAKEQTPLAGSSSCDGDLANITLPREPCLGSAVTNESSGRGCRSEEDTIEDSAVVVCQEALVGDSGMQVVADTQQGMADPCGVHSELNLDGDELLAVWNEFYNSTYWYMYHYFTGFQPQQQDDEEKEDEENGGSEHTSDVNSPTSEEEEESVEVECDRLPEAVDKLSISQLSSANDGHFATADSASWELSGRQLTTDSSAERTRLDAECNGVGDDLELSEQLLTVSQGVDCPASFVEGSEEEMNVTIQPVGNKRRRQSRYE